MLMDTSMKKKTTELIVNPPKIKNLNRSRAFFIPADTPGKVIKKYLEQKADKKKYLMFSRLYFLKKSVVLLGGIGAPAAVLAVEPLIVSGVDEIIVLGFCGGLSRKTNLFDVYLINKAFSEEGTSSYYIPEKKEFFPSERLNQETSQKLISQQIVIKKASLVSTDAPYRETKKWLAHKQKMGIDLVDMEVSALLALAEYHGVKAAAVMVVSDIIKDDSHQIGFLKTKFSKQIKKTFFSFLE